MSSLRQATLLTVEQHDLTPRQIIDGAFNLLLDPKRWAKYVFLARDSAGRETTALHKDAQSWTLIGALRRSADDLGMPTELGWAPVLWQAYDLVEAGIPPGHVNLLSFNNAPWTEHADIVKLLASTLERIDRDSRFHSAPDTAQAGDPAAGLSKGPDQQEVSAGSAPGREREAA